MHERLRRPHHRERGKGCVREHGRPGHEAADRERHQGEPRDDMHQVHGAALYAEHRMPECLQGRECEQGGACEAHIGRRWRAIDLQVLVGDEQRRGACRRQYPMQYVTGDGRTP